VGKYWVTSPDGTRHRTAAGNAREYSRYQSSKKAKRDRAARNRNRREAEREGRVHKGDGKEIDHIDSSASHNSRSNLRIVSRTFNRSRKENSRRRGSRRRKDSWGL